MANNIIFNTKILRGAKGERGDAAGGDLPTNSVLYYDGDDTPVGFTTTSDPTGGGGGGGGTPKVDKATELYGYIATANGEFTLNDSIDNYDFITFTYGISENRSEMTTTNIYVNDINYLYANDMEIFLVGYGSRYIKLKLNGDNLTVTGRGGDNTPVIYRIVGYKKTDYVANERKINVVAYGRGRDVNTTTTWTAPKAGKYLVANINVNSDNGDKVLASGITSTGEILSQWQSAGTSSEDTRCYNMTWALISCGIGDTVTLDRGSSGSYSIQSYAIYELANISGETITNEFIAMKPDNTLNGTYTLTPTDNMGCYIAFTYVAKADTLENLNYNDFTISDNGTEDIKINTYPYPYASNLMIDLAYYADTFTFKASSVNGYVTKGYGLFKLN